MATIIRNGVAYGGGTSDYEQLNHKPSINGVPLVDDKSLSDLGINYATSMTAGIVKPDGVTTIVGADGTLSVAVPNFYVDNNGYICINYGNS